MDGESDYVFVGNGTLLFGDALELMKCMSDESVDLIVTDPPYKTISGGKNFNPKHPSGFSKSVIAPNDGKIFKHNDVKIYDYMSEFFRLLKPGSHCYVMTNNLNLQELLAVAKDVGFGFHNLLVWEKNTVNANRWYMKGCEWVCFFNKKPAKKINHVGSKQIFRCNNPRNKLHPTEKPVELMEHYILNSTKEDDIVLDPFAGSGSTLVAAEKNNRSWIGIEIDMEYYDVALRRLKEI